MLQLKIKLLKSWLHWNKRNVCIKLLIMRVQKHHFHLNCLYNKSTNGSTAKCLHGIISYRS